MNKDYIIGRTALEQTIGEMYYELTGTDIEIAYAGLSKFTAIELIEVYGSIYNEYYNNKEV